MSDCGYVNERLDDYLDGTLDPAARERVEAHLASCARCAADARGLREVLTAARGLPRSVSPPPGVWQAIDRRLDERAVRGRIGRVVTLRPATLAAAAAVLVLLTATITTLTVRRSAGPPVAIGVEAVEGDPTALVEEEFRTAVRELERALAERRGDLSPAALAVVEQSLQVIDAAILEARSALAGDRDNVALAAVLWNSYRSKVDLLARATRL
jgi:anti-sigma factor RsiW